MVIYHGTMDIESIKKITNKNLIQEYARVKSQKWIIMAQVSRSSIPNSFGLPPHPGCQSQIKMYKGSRSKKCNNPGCDWNPEWRVDPKYSIYRMPTILSPYDLTPIIPFWVTWKKRSEISWKSALKNSLKITCGTWKIFGTENFPFGKAYFRGLCYFVGRVTSEIHDLKGKTSLWVKRPNFVLGSNLFKHI